MVKFSDRPNLLRTVGEMWKWWLCCIKLDHPIQLYLRNLFCWYRDTNLALGYVNTVLQLGKLLSLWKNALLTNSLFLYVRNISNGSSPNSYLLCTPGSIKFNSTSSQAAKGKLNSFVQWKKHLFSVNYLAWESEGGLSALKQPMAEKSRDTPRQSERAAQPKSTRPKKLGVKWIARKHVTYFLQPHRSQLKNSKHSGLKSTVEKS